MASPLYELSIDAQHDIESILEYTLENFGPAQVETYGANLIKCVEDLAMEQGGYKTLTRGNRKVRMLHCHKHFIFGIQRPSKPLLVIAVLHERMDLMRRLTGRI